jgi:hypothetical protein
VRRTHATGRGLTMPAKRQDFNAGRLRLRAVSTEDVEVLSTLLQDAIIPGEDMTFDRRGRRFVMVANRFCWDRPAVAGVTTDSGAPVYERQLCGVQIHGIEQVRTAGMPASRRGALFNLLAITAGTTEDGANVEMLFSGGVSVRLDADSLLILAEDLDEGRPTPHLPSHNDDQTP